MGRALTHAPYWSTVARDAPRAAAGAAGGRRRAARRAGRSRRARSSPISTPPRTSRSSAATRSGSSRAASESCCRRTTSPGRSASSPAARPGARLASSELLPQLRVRSLAALALEACGVGSRALELAVGYVKEREQFGKPIGIYQAISHPLAKTLMELELGRSLALFAAWCIAEDDERGADRGRLGEGALRRRRRRRVRALDPGSRRHRLHLGARPPPALQARALDPVVGGLGRTAALRGRRLSARRRQEVTCRG